MIEIHRGAGMLAPGFGLLAAISMNVFTTKVLGDSYYQEHDWPTLSVLILSGLACLVVGLWLKKKRLRDAPLEKAYIDSLSPKFQAVKSLAFSGPRDHLMFIPLQYWSIVYFVAAIIYVVKRM